MENIITYVLYGVDVVFYVFAAIGLFTLAKKNNIKHAWIAWIPLVQYFLLGKLLDGKKSKTYRFYAVMTAVTYVLTIAALILYYKAYERLGESINYDWELLDQAPAGYEATTNVYYYMNSFLSIVNTVFCVLLLIGFFKLYLPDSRYTYLYTIFSVLFGVQGLFIFMYRNREPISRNSGYGPGAPYNHGGPYNQNPSGAPYNGSYGQPYNQSPGQPPAPEPFPDFKDQKDNSPDDPFSEF